MAYVQHGLEIGNDRVFLWGITQNLHYFLESEPAPWFSGGVSNVQISRKAYSRQSYPGDSTPTNMPSSSAVVLSDNFSTNSRRALPGRPVIFEKIAGRDANGNLVIDERRQFTLQGSLTKLHAYLMANADGPMRMISSRGRAYYIKYEEISTL